MRIPTRRLRELRVSSTEAEKAAWNLLRDRRWGTKFRRQFRIENGVLDLYCFEHRLAIEMDGGVHSQIDQMRKDAAKEDYLQTVGIRLLRIPNALVLEHPDELVRKVMHALGARELYPHLRRHPGKNRGASGVAGLLCGHGQAAVAASARPSNSVRNRQGQAAAKFDAEEETVTLPPGLTRRIPVEVRCR